MAGAKKDQKRKQVEESSPKKEEMKKRKTKESDENADPQTKQSFDDIKEEYEKLKVKYENLMALRFTEPEKHNEQLRKESQKREEATNKLIEQLKMDKERLQAALEQKKQSNKVPSIATHSQVAELELAKHKALEQCHTLSNVLAFYQKLSSVKIVPISADTFECECFHSKLASNGVKFELSLGEEEVEYAPVNAARNADLPTFLKESICFGEEELPVFLTKLLTAVYKKQ